MRSVRWLHAVHRWCGLISGLNILLLSITGAYLVFAENIEAVFDPPKGEVIAQVPDTANTPLQEAFDRLAKHHPGAIPMGLRPAEGGKAAYTVALLERPATVHRYAFDSTSGEVRAEVESKAAAIHEFVLHLHTDLFLGTLGGVFIGMMAVIFLASNLTGIVIYTPFMKGVLYGTLRLKRGARRTSADFHKLAGVSALAFNLLMAVTGIFLTFGLLGARMWAAAEVQARTADDTSRSGIATSGAPRVPVDEILRAASAIHPDAPVSSVVFPGGFQGPQHFFCFHERQGKLEKFLPVYSLVPAGNPGGAESIDVPPWIDAAMFCVPVHFGNYGGLFLKAVYCVLGIGTGLLTISGAILTMARWRGKIRARLARARRTIPVRSITLANEEG
ncbi:MAG: PepSY domain-containing protein [Candidatus Hydrogenedentes bacterium]|nr:PepSY domain-containing protein [Candidatus Hydrogenedentota bacterium]